MSPISPKWSISLLQWPYGIQSAKLARIRWGHIEGSWLHTWGLWSYDPVPLPRRNKDQLKWFGWLALVESGVLTDWAKVGDRARLCWTTHPRAIRWHLYADESLRLSHLERTSAGLWSWEQDGSPIAWHAIQTRQRRPTSHYKDQ